MNYESMSALQLQTAGLKYAAQLRELQNEMSRANTVAMLRPMEHDPAETSEQMSERWNRRHMEDAQRRGVYVQRFCAEFRADGALLHSELLKRTGEPKISLVALDYGMLAGVSPLEEVAHEIEKLSKKLFVSMLPN